MHPYILRTGVLNSSEPLTTPDRVSLLLALVPYLQQHGRVSVSDAASHFRVPPATLRKLAVFLGTAGVPGETGTYQHEDLFDINWDALEFHDELELIQTVGVEDTPRFTSSQAAALLAGLNSISLLLTPEEAAVAASAARKLGQSTLSEQPTLSFTEESDPHQETLQLIRRAITSGTQLRFSYRNQTGDVTQRTVDPHHLMQRRNIWYVSAWCHMRESQRLFRVGYMTEVSQTQSAQQHTVSANEAPEDHPVQPEISAEVLIHVDALHRVEGWNIERIPGGTQQHIRARVALLSENRIIDFVATAPGRITVVAPPELRAMVHDWAQNILQQLGNADENNIR